METFSQVPKVATNVTVKGNYFKVNVANKIIKMRVDLTPKLPENKPALFYRVLHKVKTELKEKLNTFLIFGNGIFTPTSIDKPFDLEAEYENTKYSVKIT